MHAAVRRVASSPSLRQRLRQQRLRRQACFGAGGGSKANGSSCCAPAPAQSSIDAWGDLEFPSIKISWGGGGWGGGGKENHQGLLGGGGGGGGGGPQHQQRRASSTSAAAAAGGCAATTVQATPAPINHTLSLFDSDYGDQPPSETDFLRARAELCDLWSASEPEQAVSAPLGGSQQQSLFMYQQVTKKLSQSLEDLQQRSKVHSHESLYVHQLGQQLA